MLTILVPRLVFSSITLVILIFPLVIAYKKIKYSKNKALGYILAGTFFIQIFMSLLIMRFLPTYGSISIMILISISAWAMPQLIFEFKSLKRTNQIFVTTIIALIMIIATPFSEGALIHLDTTFFNKKTTTLKNDASYIQGHIIKNNGGGSIESYANVSWSIYDSANEYPRLKYFDQTTIPYDSQNIAGNKQYEYLKDKNAKWVHLLANQVKTQNLSKSKIEQFIIETYNKGKTKNSASSINATIDAPIERAKKYPNQYYKIGYAKIKNTIFVISPIPKPLTSNYVLVDARYNISKDVKYYWKQNKLTGNDAYLLFTTKENAQKHHLKAIPIKTLE